MPVGVVHARKMYPTRSGVTMRVSAALHGPNHCSTDKKLQRLIILGGGLPLPFEGNKRGGLCKEISVLR